MDNNVEEVLSNILSRFNDQIDELGYELLKDCGYDVTDAKTSQAVRNRIKRELSKRHEELRFCQQVKRGGVILIWFELYNHNTKKRIYSQGLKLEMRNKDGAGTGKS